MSFPPDSPLVARVVASPNREARVDVAKPDILLLHYTGMATTQAALERLCNPKARVSSHYLVFESGEIVQLVPESERAYHAGESSWEGTTDINSRSIGIEIGNQGHDAGSPGYPEPQVAAVIALCRDIVARWQIEAHHVLAHADVAPARKRDPGETFPWARLAAAGVGLWIAPEPVTAGAALRRGDAGEDVTRLQHALAQFGYGVVATGTYDAATDEAVTAFQRHFRPACVDGIADRSTIRALKKVVEKKQK